MSVRISEQSRNSPVWGRYFFFWGVNMVDLNDLYYFACIVEEGSFSGAAATLGVAKSVVSEHLAKLENCLGVRLINRTTRQIQVTELGLRFYDHCRAMVEEVKQAHHLIEQASNNTTGTMRFASTMLLAQILVGPVLGEFMRDHPETQVVLDVFNSPVDVIKGNYDIVFRASQDARDSTLIVRTLADVQPMLCASSDLVSQKGLPRTPADLAGFDTIAFPDERCRYQWSFDNDAGDICAVPLRPRLVSPSTWVILEAVLSGAGVGLLPAYFWRSALHANRLVELLPDWRPAKWTFQAVYASRHGLRPPARNFLEYLLERLPHVLDSSLEGISPVLPLA
jgi:DNA-binding transcriptional LysR family regulator